MNRVKGKSAIVTGGAGGLGRAQALLLAREGARVVVSDTREAEGRKVVEEIKAQGGEALFLRHDVSKDAEWERVMKETVSRLEKLDVLVNNAGVMIWKSIEDTSLEEWRWLMSINLDGVFLGTKHAMGVMKKSGGGSIVNISSVAGIIGTLDTSAYHASKGGVRIFTKAAALECSKAGYGYNIRVNSIHPGVIKSPMTGGLLEDEDKMKTALGWIPMGHFGDPEDVAQGVLYLASDESRYITGTELVIDGGWTAH